MKRTILLSTLVGVLAVPGSPVMATVLYNNLTPTNLMAMASRPGSAALSEIETADDFVITTASSVNSASFIGLINSPTGGLTSIDGVTVEIYRVFPLESNVNRIPNVPTRVNSPSDIAFDLRSSTAGLSFSTSVLSASFIAANSVQPGGIHSKPNQTTGGNGPIAGQEVQFDLTFSTPIDLPAGHYFFVPQVDVSGGNFYWLSALRPISGAGTTPFAPDLQVWTRDENLDPDWLRVGTDIVGGATPPTFNAAFALNGSSRSTVPEPFTIALLGLGLAGLAVARRQKNESTVAHDLSPFVGASPN